MTDSTLSLRDRALAAYATQAETDHQKKEADAEQRQQEQALGRARAEHVLRTRFENLLGITEGIRVEFPDFEEEYAVLDELPDLRFYLTTYDRLRVEATPPEHPHTPEYEEWWENAENKPVSQLNSAVIQSLADLGRFLAAREAAGPLVIQPWPPKPILESATDPRLITDRVACLTMIEANETTRPYTIVAGVTLADGTPAVIVEYNDR
ncbi:MAG: hypothetical protein HY866_02220 [Chloroflexi bacterium]|nr:hypothetical protein [Chloroflexota bacterium]